MPKIKIADYIGKKYNRLTILSEVSNQEKYSYKVNLLCDCGNSAIASIHSVIAGGTKSCGCLFSEYIIISNVSKINLTHGLSNSTLYYIYKGIKSRCYNKNSPYYNYYGGRGIAMCDEWLNDFVSFYDWAMANGYQKGLKIDRIKNNLNYSPDNCRFLNDKDSSRNRRNVHLIEHENKQVFLIDLWEKSPVGRKAFYYRLKSGWSLEKALTAKNQAGVKLL